MKSPNFLITIRILKYGIKHKKIKFFVIVFISLIGIFIPIISMLNTQNIVNGIQQHVSFFSFEMMSFIILYPVLIFLNELLGKVNDYFVGQFADELNYYFSVLLLEIVNKQDLNEFEDSEFYDLMQRAESAGGQYPFSLISGLINIFVLSISTVSYIIIVMSWKWWTIIILIVFPVISSFQIKNINHAEYLLLRNRAKFERRSWYYAHLLNKDINVKETRLFGLESFFLSSFKAIRKKFINENNLMRKKRAISTFIAQFISILATFSIVFLIFYDASVGLVLIGSLMTIINSVSNIKNNFSSILSGLYKIHEDSLFCQDIIHMLDYNFEESNTRFLEMNNINTEIESIEFENVSFKYPKSNLYALKNLNIKFERDNKYVIIGQNGSGKSTLLKLLAGFYRNYEGKILINGIELKRIDLEDYRKKITAVFQDFTNYQFKIKEIVSISDLLQFENDFKVSNASEMAGASGFIEKLPLKYEQQIGTWFEGGMQISGGEWQKLSIARAYYRNRANLVLFDEPSSALDPISESSLYSSFNKFATNKISIFITHRVSNFSINGKIMVMENGEIKEYGDSSELLKDNDSMYYKMVHIKNNLQ